MWKSKFTTILKITFFPLAACLLDPLHISAQQQPFHGNPLPIPGTIEAEDYDTGGEGIAYNDTDSENQGGQYRANDAVDIEATTEHGYNIGWIQPGEWLEYTVDVQHTGIYQFEIRFASASAGGSFHIEFAGSNVTGTIQANATGDWHAWEAVFVNNVSLSKGVQVMRFVAESSGFNFNYITISSLTSNPPHITLTSPEDGTDFAYGVDIPLTADAADSNGTISKVEFYADEEKIGEDITEPWEFLWQQPSPGKYDLRGKAIDNDGEEAWSEKIDITVLYPVFSDSLTFSHNRGFYDAPFTLEISTGIANASIRYTLDGSNPLHSKTAFLKTLPVHIFIDPDNTSGRGKTPGVVLRAVGLQAGIQQTKITTKTYIFVDKVKTQAHPGGLWPSSGINGQQWHYEMNQQVANDSRYRDLLDDALLDIPSISLVTDQQHLFSADSGIYVNAFYHGIAWERPVSVELLNPDETKGFQIDAGMRIRGGWSRHPNYPKHAFRLFFRVEYGTEYLNYPLFENEGTGSFRKIDLRTSQNYAWSNGYVHENTMNRDVFSRDLQREMGQPYTRSRYYHLYLNGIYWGLFQTQERSEARYAESYFGGDNDDYDVVKVDVGEDFNLYDIEATDGTLDAWRDVWNALNEGFQSNRNYFALLGKNEDGSSNPEGRKLIDIDNLIDYMLTIFYAGNFDAPVTKFRGDRVPNNFYALYNRDRNDGFIFLNHDAEHTLHVDAHSPGIGLYEDRVNLYLSVSGFNKFHPQYLHQQLALNEEYRMRFADLIYRHMFNNGALTESRVRAIFEKRTQEIELAIIAESARWGDLNRSKHNAWQPAIDQIVQQFFPNRGEIVLQQLRQAGLYPAIAPPIYRTASMEITDLELPLESSMVVELAEPDGADGFIFYTLDGSDPRRIGGGISSNATGTSTSTQLNIISTTKIMSRMYNDGKWSALHELTLIGNTDFNTLQITEIHYHPTDEGENSGKLYEFIELQNTGESTLDLSLAAFDWGIGFTFPIGTFLEPEKFVVLASDSTHF
ncbi:MAG: hypothetical protein DWQ10_14345, partial [Calditrichaeota bacterium]